MDFKKLSTTQEILDEHINKVHGLSGYEVTQKRMLALLVEIGEFANETRCFKFWSSKPPSEKEVILFEFVDCMHFLLSIGNYNGFTIASGKEFNEELSRSGSTTELFIEFFLSVVEFRNISTPLNYLDMWNHFMSIGKRLDFSKQEMYDAYMQKNEVNHQRQASGY